MQLGDAARIAPAKSENRFPAIVNILRDDAGKSRRFVNHLRSTRKTSRSRRQ